VLIGSIGYVRTIIHVAKGILGNDRTSGKNELKRQKGPE
jgi:hypothetical protein